MVINRKLSWCRLKKKGIKIQEPSTDLANEYMNSAKETFSVLKLIEGKSKMWTTTTKYYCEYFTIYALLIKMGIRSEIHECTIELAQVLEQEGYLHEGTTKQLRQDKELRTDNQYYLQNRPADINYDELLKFMLSVQETMMELTHDECEQFRAKILSEL